MATKDQKESSFYFDLIPQHEFDDIYYASTFTLKKDDSGNILLYPDDRYIKRKSFIFSHNNVIFEGEMPEMMLIAVQPGIKPKHLNDMLQLRIEIKSNA